MKQINFDPKAQQAAVDAVQKFDRPAIPS